MRKKNSRVGKNKETVRIKQHPVRQIRVCNCKQWVSGGVAIRHCEIRAILKIKIIEIVGH